MKHLILCVLSLLLPVTLLADSAISSQRQQELKNLLIQDCGSCHGLTMKGGLGPALLPENLISRPASVITGIILDGRPGTAMPAWRPLLTVKEAEWLTAQLLEDI